MTKSDIKKNISTMQISHVTEFVLQNRTLYPHFATHNDTSRRKSATIQFARERRTFSCPTAIRYVLLCIHIHLGKTLNVIDHSPRAKSNRESDKNTPEKVAANKCCESEGSVVCLRKKCCRKYSRIIFIS